MAGVLNPHTRTQDGSTGGGAAGPNGVEVFGGGGVEVSGGGVVVGAG